MTTFALGFLGPDADETHPACLNWGHPGVPPRPRAAELPGGRVVIDLIVDGHRDMRSALARRLPGARLRDPLHRYAQRYHRGQRGRGSDDGTNAAGHDATIRKVGDCGEATHGAGAGLHPPGRVFGCVFDFGDDWWHPIARAGGMRLSDSDRRAIRAVVERRFGSGAKALLFGSRVDDTRLGGDIDLLIELPHAVDQPLVESVRLEVDLMRALGERRIDILLSYPAVADQPFHALARRAAVPV